MSQQTIVVAGLGRCGSSLMMQMLNAGGVSCLGESPGFEDAAWTRTLEQDPERALDAAQGLAVKALAPFLNPRALPAPRPGLRWISCTRVIDEQASSLMKFTRLVLGLEYASRAPLVESLQRDQLALSLELAKQAEVPDVEVLVVSFEGVITRPYGAAAAIASFLERDLDIERMGDVVVPRSPACIDGLLEPELIDRSRA